jgi:Fe2+ transport system protein B
MARVAFVMDGLLKKLGLSGRAIVPMLLGFGCSVPAYMSTRTLSSQKEKRFAALLVPFMPCSAKIPVYAVFTAAFFARQRALVTLSLYALSVLFGVFYALIMKKTAFKNAPSPFVMELPPYRLPSLKTVGLYLFDKAGGFLTKAFTVIFLSSLGIWFLRAFAPNFTYAINPEESVLAIISKGIAPIFKPLGFGDWRAVTAVISGLIAKEAVISSLAVLTGAGREGLQAMLQTIFGPEEAYSFLVFCTLYMPCVAALSAFSKELKSKKFAAIAMGGQCIIAYIASLIIYSLLKI